MAEKAESPVQRLSATKSEKFGGENPPPAEEGMRTRLIRGYVRKVDQCPGICMVCVGIIMLVLSAVGGVTREAPDFSAAEKGFDARGTELSGRMVALNYHLQDSQCEGDVSRYPKGNRSYEVWNVYKDDDQAYDDTNRAYCNDPDDSRRLTSNAYANSGWGPSLFGSIKSNKRRAKSNKHHTQLASGTPLASTFSSESGVDFSSNTGVGHSRSLLTVPTPVPTSVPSPVSDNGRLCSEDHEVEYEAHIKLVFEPKGSNLMTTSALKGMCTWGDLVYDSSYYTARDTTIYNYDENGDYIGSNVFGCKPYTIGMALAWLLGVYECDDLTDQDVEDGIAILETCAPWFYNQTITTDVEHDPPAALPPICYKENMVYLIFNSLVDSSYLNPDVKNNDKLELAQVTLMTGNYDDEPFVDMHQELLLPLLNTDKGGATLVAYDLNDIKGTLFSQQLIYDFIYVVIAFIIIYTIMASHAESMFIASFAFLQMFSAFGVAYFIYQTLLWMPFFPFLNLTGIYIVLGIGADDVFVLMEAWRQSETKLGNVASLEDRMVHVLNTAGEAMFVTSITTSAAFFANAVNYITSIKCFGLYCGLVVLADFVLMLLFMPAVILFYEKSIKTNGGKVCCVGCCPEVFCNTEKHPGNPVVSFFATTTFDGIFVKFGEFIKKYGWAMWIFGAAFGVPLAIFCKDLDYPTAESIQLFQSSHPMERYTFEFMDRFEENSDTYNFPAYFVWGIEPTDNGNYWDPNDFGSVDYTSVNFADKDAQQWMVDFCEAVRTSNWYESSYADDCWIDTVVSYMDGACDDGNHGSASTCCGYNSTRDFPFEEDEFTKCTAEVGQAYGGYYDGWNTPRGVWFDADGSNSIKAVVSFFSTTEAYSNAFEKAKNFDDDMKSWFEKQLKSAPSTLRGGFFVSDLGDLALKEAIGEGAYESAGVATMVAILVLLVMTQNLLITAFAGSVIGLIVACITGILVLSGWTLGVIQSIIFSCAIGMSIDFVAHLSHAYGHGLESGMNPFDAVSKAVAEMGPSITMAATSTAVAGAVMMLSVTLFLWSYGQFMLMIMFFAWLFAFITLLPMLGYAGPVVRLTSLHYIIAKVKGADSDTSKKPAARDGEPAPADFQEGL